MRGWVPHDEGLIGHSAERILLGELPHRDFTDVYTGGLAFFHARLFQAFGISLAWPRVAVLCFFLASLVATFYIATRLSRPLPAAALTLLTAAWGLTAYPAAMPSWYNLYFALFGTAAIFRHLETNRRRWLTIAGLCAGLSVLVKVSGLYFVAAVLIFLLFREQSLNPADETGAEPRRNWYLIFLIAVAAVTAAVLLRTVSARLGAAQFVFFVLPGCALAGVVAGRELGRKAQPLRERVNCLLGLVIPFLAGLAVPIVAFLIPYVRSGSTAALVRGVFVLPFRRTAFAFVDATLLSLMFPLVLFALLIAGAVFRTRIRAVHVVCLALVLFGALFATGSTPLLYWGLWFSVGSLSALVVPAGAWQAARMSRDSSPDLRTQQLFMLLCASAFCELVRFPFSTPTYFYYVAPLLVLTTTALTTSWRTHGGLLWVLGAFYFAFAVVHDNPISIWQTSQYYLLPDLQTHVVHLPRAGGIRGFAYQTAEYERMAALVRQHVRGDYIYAAPDCPEVYFLTGLRNPTPALFDFLDEPSGKSERIWQAIQSHHINLVVIDHDPQFSGPLPAALVQRLVAEFPKYAMSGRFEIRWHR